MDEAINKAHFLHRGKIARAVALLDKQSAHLHDPQLLKELLTEKVKWLEDNHEAISPTWTVYSGWLKQTVSI